MTLVLDSSALFSMENLPEEDSVCPPGVVRELTKYKDPRLELWGDMLRTSDCSSEAMKKVEEAARKTGDLGRLSPVDMSVIALALDVDGTVLSDDFSILNVCTVMGIPNRSVGTKGIKKVEKWNYQCIGCKKWYKERSNECPICGSPMKSFRKK
ncbi:MAG: nucleic acid-binding protein [Candidatus Methanomethylophilaceae archaeon]|nr:nucleic acid-binding protein [Candidatus Methanomethylophilaceae archaeon]